MKKLAVILVTIILFATQFCAAQQTSERETTNELAKSIFLEGGVNISVPVHIQMYRSHRVWYWPQRKDRKKDIAKNRISNQDRV
jgi:hypothetical protein